MKKVMMVGTEEYNSNDFLFAKGRSSGAYVGVERANRVNMIYLMDNNSDQTLQWVDLEIESTDPNVDLRYVQTASDTPAVTGDVLMFDDPINENKVCFLKKALYDSYQSIWDTTGIVDQAALDAEEAASYQAAWPNHDANLAQFLYGVTETKSLTFTNAQRFGLYNQALTNLGLEVDYDYDPPRGPIEEAVHEYAVLINAA